MEKYTQAEAVTSQPTNFPSKIALSEYAQPAVTAFSQIGVPTALQFLATLNKIDVHQVVHMIEVCTSFEIQNEYQITTEQGLQFMHASEESACCERQCCHNLRSFVMHINDMRGEEVIRLIRPLRCMGFCCCCCLQEMEIQSPPGNPIGYLKEVHTFHVPWYDVLDANHDLLFKIRGACCYCKCCTDVDFKIYNGKQTEEVAKIAKHWSGFRECCAEANDFSLIFPEHMEVMSKAILLGATFLIDFMYFEEQNKNHGNHGN